MKIWHSIMISMCIATYAHAQQQFDIQLVDQKGRRIQEIPAGQPFKLKATIEGAGRASNQVVIHGLAPFHIVRSICRMTHINGRSSVTHERELRVDAPGLYTIGPVEYNDNGVTYRSHTVQLKVGQPAELEQTLEEQGDRQLAFLELSTDKKTAYVGEKVTCTMFCYFLGNELAISSLNQPTLEGWRIAEQPEEGRGKKEINGQEYDVVILVWQMCAEQAGDLTIPAFGADFLREMPAHAFPFGFGMFGRSALDTKRFYSNACSIKIMPLPAGGPAQAVGTFSQFTAQLNRMSLKTGDAAQLTLILKGDGDWERITYSALQGMPQGLKWYDSKQTQQKNSKQFEFVVQALEPGVWEIPPQTFTFFDTQTKKYQTLKTAALEIKVAENKALKTVAPPPPPQEPATLELNTPSQEIVLAPLYREFLAHKAERAMQWWLFWTIALVFFLTGMVPVFRRSYINRVRSNMRYYAYKKAYTQAHKELRIARTNHDAAAIYTIMIELCAARLKVPRETLTHHQLEQALQDHGMDHYTIQEWRQFIEQAAQYAFTPAQVDEHIFDRAQKWLGQLKGIV